MTMISFPYPQLFTDCFLANNASYKNSSWRITTWIQMCHQILMKNLLSSSFSWLFPSFSYSLILAFSFSWTFYWLCCLFEVVSLPCIILCHRNTKMSCPLHQIPKVPHASCQHLSLNKIIHSSASYIKGATSWYLVLFQKSKRCL